MCNTSNDNCCIILKKIKGGDRAIRICFELRTKNSVLTKNVGGLNKIEYINHVIALKTLGEIRALHGNINHKVLC